MQDLAQHLSVLKRHGYKADEAVILLMRIQLMKIIKGEIDKRQWSQREAAKVLEVSQPRIAEISVLATERFSLELLIKFLHRLDLRTSLKISKSKHYDKPKKRRRPSTTKPAAKTKKEANQKEKLR